MRIVQYGPGSFLEIAQNFKGTTDQEFLEDSKRITRKLAESQLARRIPGGMLIIFDGTVGVPDVPFVGVIKAETQPGFRRSRAGSRAVIEFLENIFLTPATRLYKIGLVVFDDFSKEPPNGRRAFVFDSNISASSREAAAAYFYETFLGYALPSDGRYETAKFFDLTKEFIRKSDLDAEKKRDMVDSLYVFTRNEKDPTFTARQFSDRYLRPDLQDKYVNFMERKNFTAGAVVRDISAISGKLRRRRLKFGDDIEFSATPEALNNSVKIESFSAEDSSENTWTRITVMKPFIGEQ